MSETSVQSPFCHQSQDQALFVGSYPNLQIHKYKSGILSHLSNKCENNPGLLDEHQEQEGNKMEKSTAGNIPPQERVCDIYDTGREEFDTLIITVFLSHSNASAIQSSLL